MTDNFERQNEKTLESWKEIAAYLKRDVRTVIRWEKNEGLPVRRHQHQARASVYAYPSELDAWLATRQPVLELALPWYRRPAAVLALTATLLLALASVASGPLVNPPGVAAQDGTGIVARQVWAGSEADGLGSPSAEGRYLSYTDWETGDLAVRDLMTGKSHRLTHKGSWAESSAYAEFSRISPDGQQIAYAWFNGQTHYELRVVGLDGSNPRILYGNEDVPYLQPTDWSPDGRHIATVLSRRDRATRQIVLVSVVDGSALVLKTLDWRYPGRVSFSPDGRYLAYDLPPTQDSPQRDIFLLASDGSREVSLVEHPADDFLLGWAPEGDQIIFASDRTGTIGAWTLRLAAGQPEGPPELLRQELGRIFPMGFSPSGSFYYSLAGMRDVYVGELDAAGGRLVGTPKNATERFLGTNFGPDWSPDGQYLAWISRRGRGRGPGSKVVVIRSLQTGEEREFAPKITIDVHTSWPRWSPDGGSVVLTGNDLKGRHGLYRLDVQSGEVSPIRQDEPGEASQWPQWLPDGKSILLFRVRMADPEAIPSLVVRDLETGQERTLQEGRGVWGCGGFGGSGALSPDGRQLAFVMATTGKCRVMILPLASGEPRELLELPEGEMATALAWTPDGRYLLFTKVSQLIPNDDPAFQKQVWRIPVAGGQPEATQLFLAPRQLRALRFHPDGRRIAFSLFDDSRAGIWVLENFLPESEVARTQ